MRSDSTSSGVSAIFQNMREAAQNKQLLAVNANGDITTGERVSVGKAGLMSFRALFVRDDDEALRRAVVSKLMEDARALLPEDPTACETLIRERVPALSDLSCTSMALESHLAKNLEEQWEDFKKKMRAEAQSRVLDARQATIDEMNRFMPAGLELMAMDDAVFRKKCQLSANAQSAILDSFVQLERDPIGPSGIHAQAEKDLNRATFRFIYREPPDAGEQQSPPVSLELPPGNGALVLEHLKSICGNDPTTLATVSKMIGQRALAPLIAGIVGEFSPRDPAEPLPVFSMESLHPNTPSGSTENMVYSIEQTGDGRLLIGGEYYRQGNTMTDGAGNNSWPINRSARWSGPPGPHNATLSGSYCLSTQLSDLAQGRIRPVYVKPAQACMQIEPDLPPLQPPG